MGLVLLLEKKPEFVPMWPPVIKYEDGYVVDENVKTVYGYISSGNEEPKVYEFKENRALYNELFIDDKVARVYMDCVFRLNGTACTLQREGCPLQTGSFLSYTGLRMFLPFSSRRNAL